MAAMRLAEPALLVKQLDLQRYFELVRVFAERNLKARYRGSILGVYWSLLNPLLMTGVYSAIFGTAFLRFYDGSYVKYALACFVGLVVLNTFSQTTSAALGSIVHNGALMNKLAMPPGVFPAGQIVANGFQFVVGPLPLLIAVTLYNTHSLANVAALAIPCASLLMLICGFSLIVASLFVFFRDLPYFYELIVFVLWLTSPIFYPRAVVPANVLRYLDLNPVGTIMESVRTIVFVPGVHGWHTLALGLISGAISLAIGLIVFFSTRRDFMDLI
jgi:ABC-type polysaccharide/polyol phosphate export permease